MVWSHFLDRTFKVYGSIVVRGTFSWHYLGPPLLTNLDMNKSLAHNVHPYTLSVFFDSGVDGIFHPDNLTCHMTRNVQHNLKDRGQDLNPIKQLWHQLSGQIHSMDPQALSSEGEMHRS